MKNNNVTALAQGTILKGEVNTYKIKEVLGQGTFGITYLATTQEDASCEVAIKEFFMRDVNMRAGSEISGGSDKGLFGYYKTKFINESRNLRTLNHPNIVKVKDSFEANNTAYYVMEYCSGGSLDNKIRTHSGLSVDVAMKHILELCDAVSYMHSKKMLHLDIKPGNVVLNNEGRAMLIDFGLSKQFDENGNPESSTTLGAGTEGYAPTEQINYHSNGKTFPVTMDVYAIGATLYKMLVGSVPPNASIVLNDPGRIPNALNEAGVDKGIIDIVVKAMSPIVYNRYSNVASFAQALRSIENTVVTTPPNPHGKYKKRVTPENIIWVDTSHYFKNVNSFWKKKAVIKLCLFVGAILLLEVICNLGLGHWDNGYMGLITLVIGEVRYTESWVIWSCVLAISLFLLIKGIINRKNIVSQVDKIEFTDKKEAIVKGHNGKYGIVNKKCHQILPIEYECIEYLYSGVKDKGVFVCQNKGLCGLFVVGCGMVIPVAFEKITYLGDDIFEIMQDGITVRMNSKGQRI